MWPTKSPKIFDLSYDIDDKCLVWVRLRVFVCVLLILAGSILCMQLELSMGFAHK